MKAKIASYQPTGFRKGRLVLDLEWDFRPQYDRLKSDYVEVTIEDYSDGRTLRSNKYLWQLITKIANVLRENKEDIYLDMLKAYGQGGAVSVQDKYVEKFKQTYKYHEYLGESELNGKKFQHFRFWVGSSEYNREEFSILLDGVVEEARGLGIEVRPPEEVASMLAEMEA